MRVFENPTERELRDELAELTPIRRLLKLFHSEAIPVLGAAIYDALSADMIFQRAYEVVAGHVLEHCSQGSLLDIGTGPGRLLVKLHEAGPQLDLVGMNLSQAMVRRARANMRQAGLADRVQIREGNVANLPFADGAFDIAVSTGSVHHWKDPEGGLDEVHRVLKPGGRALIYDVVSDTPPSVLTEAGREFGRLKTLLFWLHGFEEPFYSQAACATLARPTHFREGRVSFVSILCCLNMQKGQH